MARSHSRRPLPPPPPPTDKELAALARASAGELLLRDPPPHLDQIPAAEEAKRALEVAAAGHHCIALIPGGPNGRAIATLLLLAYARALPFRPAPLIGPRVPGAMGVLAYAHDVDFLLPPPAESEETITRRVCATAARLAAARLDAATRGREAAVLWGDAQVLADAAAGMHLGLDLAPGGELMRVAHTVAVLDGDEVIRRAHLAEALSYFLSSRTERDEQAAAAAGREAA